MSGATVCWPPRADPRHENQFRSHPLPAGSPPESEDRRGWCHAGCQKIIAALPRRYIGAHRPVGGAPVISKHHPGPGYLGTPEHFTRSAPLRRHIRTDHPVGAAPVHWNTSSGQRCACTSIHHPGQWCAGDMETSLRLVAGGAETALFRRG